MYKYIVFDLMWVIFKQWHIVKFFVNFLMKNNYVSDISYEKYTNIKKIYKKYKLWQIDNRLFWTNVFLCLNMEIKKYKNFEKIFLEDLFMLNEWVSDLIYYLKNKWYLLWIISNLPFDWWIFIERKYSFFKSFQTKIISWFVKTIKQNKDIFEIFIKKTWVKRNSVFFIDDKENNLLTAKNIWMSVCLLSENEFNNWKNFIKIHSLLELKTIL